MIASAPRPLRRSAVRDERLRLAVGLASMAAFPLAGAASQLGLMTRSGYLAAALLSLAAFALAVAWPERDERARRRR